MLPATIFARSRRHRWSTEGGAGSGGPCGLGLAPQALGAASGSDPAGTMTRKRDSSRGWEHRANAAQVDRPGTRGRARTRENAAVERREASTRRNRVLDASLGVQAVPVWHGQGAGASRTERFSALYPLVFEGTKKEASPARFAVTTDRPGR